MKPWAESFYKSYNWQQTRDAFLKSKGGLCELCLKQGLTTPAEIVHHKKPLTQTNIHDPKISLAWENLMAVCREHHEELHRKGAPAKRYKIDKDGHVIVISN